MCSDPSGPSQTDGRLCARHHHSHALSNNHMTTGKVIILSAPSGSGKSTIIEAIIGRPELDLQFSVSATCRPPRGAERDGVEYYFLTPEEFSRRAAAGEFIEWEEVYPGRCYGTLRSEIDRITSAGHNVIMDIDVKGAVNVKRLLGPRAISIFIQPPLWRSCGGALRAAPPTPPSRLMPAWQRPRKSWATRHSLTPWWSTTFSGRLSTACKTSSPTSSAEPTDRTPYG